jgi:hypothetical protein
LSMQLMCNNSTRSIGFLMSAMATSKKCWRQHLSFAVLFLRGISLVELWTAS